MKPAKKPVRRSWKVWVLLAPDGEPYAATTRHEKSNVPGPTLSGEKIAPATLTLASPKRRRKT